MGKRVLGVAAVVTLAAGLSLSLVAADDEGIGDLSRLPLVLWSAQVKDRNTVDIQALNGGKVVASRHYYASELFGPKGESLLVFPGERVNGQEDKGMVFLDDGGYIRLVADTKDYVPGKPFVTMTRYSYEGEVLWAKLLENKGSRGSLQRVENTIVTADEISEIVDQRQIFYYRITGYGMDGERNWLVDTPDSRELGYLTITNNSRLMFSSGGKLKCFDINGDLLWEHQSWGIRLGFQIMPSGNSYAFLKVPERLVKVDPYGKISWECNIAEHVEGELGMYFEGGHQISGYITEAPDGTVYAFDAYGAITAVSGEGEYLWSVSEPRPPGMVQEEWEMDQGFWLYDNSDLSVAPDGTLYMKSRYDNLMAVSPKGEILFIDRRFADVDCAVEFGYDGTVYVGSAGWLYALDPRHPAKLTSLPEQEMVYEEERQRELEWQEEFAREQEKFPPAGDPEVQPEPAAVFDPDNPPEPGTVPVADRTVVAGLLVSAMSEYYGKHGEFPPFLLGAAYGDDPLIAEGILDEYPLTWPQYDHHDCRIIEEIEGDGKERWKCAVSTPGDLSKPMGFSVSGRSYTDRSARLKRGNCLSISPEASSGNGTTYFGYQRGDWLGRGANEAWLWFYGSNIWPEQNNPLPEWYGEGNAMEYYDLYNEFSSFGPQGFDLLNPVTGELIPDGKRDGVCLLYRLVDGKLAEVLRADGI